MKNPNPTYPQETDGLTIVHPSFHMERSQINRSTTKLSNVPSFCLVYPSPTPVIRQRVGWLLHSFFASPPTASKSNQDYRVTCPAARATLEDFDDCF
jgi:hypothetical protein